MFERMQRLRRRAGRWQYLNSDKDSSTIWAAAVKQEMVEVDVYSKVTPKRYRDVSKPILLYLGG